MTIWAFQDVVCFSTPYTRIFVASRCSAAYIFRIACIATFVLFPLFAAFASDNIWVKEGSYREQPYVSFAHEMLVVLGGTSASDAVGWGTHSALDSLLPPDVKVPIVRSAPYDVNHDGLTDSWKLSLDMPTGDITKGYQHVFLLAVYNVELRTRVREKMSGLIAIDINAPYPATGVWVQGQLRFRQNTPLHINTEVREVYTQSPLAINFGSSWATAHQPLSVQGILERYAARNETVFMDQVLPAVWDYSPRERFEIRLSLDVVPQHIYYIPGSLEVLKWAWMQMIAFLVPTWAVLQALQAFAFDKQVVETYVVPDLPGKGMS